METESLIANPQPSIMQRLLPSVVPVLFIAIAYVDPGKWAAAVEGGARFGYDLTVLMFIFSFAAILCQYLSACISVVTGRDLAQICSVEYGHATCILLGVQAELSMIALDLSMILGTAHGLNLTFGMGLFTCVFLTSLDAILFPLFSRFLDTSKAKFLCVRLSSFVLITYLFGVLTNQPETDTLLPRGFVIPKLSGESAFTWMSLLGANIMPHNFYLHSSIVQQDQGPEQVSKGALCHDHFFSISCIFSGILLVNCVLMNSAANVFYNAGLELLTFPDVLNLMDQAFRSLMAPFALILVLVLSNHTTALTWKLGGQVVLHNFFKMDIPSWLHHSIIRIIAIFPALCCVSHSGAEGTYQLLIFTQIVVALLLPSSVIPLFRVASSLSVMGVNKISQFLEFLAVITYIGMLILESIFVIEMIFGNSDWASNLRSDMGSSMSVSYIVLLLTAFVSLCLMLWLVVTPLKSESSRADARQWELQASVPESFEERDENDFSEPRYRVDSPKQKQEPTFVFDKSLEYHPDLSISTPDPNLPEEVLLDNDRDPKLTTIEENSSDLTFSRSPVCQPEESATTVEMVLSSVVPYEVSDGESLDGSTLKTEQLESEEKTLRIDGNLQTVKDNNQGETWEPEESSKVVPGSNPSLSSEGQGSFKSLSGKSDDIGSGAGSLSKLAGLGRAARRQLAGILDEFWGQLFDFHGEATQEAKTRKLDKLLGVVDSKVNSKPAPASLKVDNSVKEYSGYIPSVSGGGSDSMLNPSLYDSSRQQCLQSSIDSSYDVQRRSSSLLSSQMQLLDAYVQHSSLNALDPGEKRYHSLRLPLSSGGLRLSPASGGYDDQPATVHGYQIKSYINQTKQRSSDYLHSQMEPLAPKSPSLVSPNYKAPYSSSSAQKPQNGLSPAKPPGFPDPAVSRNSSLQPERTFYNLRSTGPAENMSSAVNEKKYYSMPDISGLSLPHRDSLLSDGGPQWDSSTRYGTLGRKMYGQSLYSGPSYRAGAAPLAYGEFSSSKVYRDASSRISGPDTWSMWSRQPFEQFGVADKARNGGDEVETRPSLISQETASAIDFEANLLKSFRHCIVKLLKLEGSDWLFKQNGGVDEDLIDRVAARERFLYEAETKEMNRVAHVGESQFPCDRKHGSALKIDEADYTKFLVTSVPNCGEGCIWRVDLIISFGVWCIHRVLELSLMESRPELWGKYTYVLNHLQGIIDLAFSKPRTPMNPCFCLQLPISYEQRSSPPISNGSLPPPAKQSRGKCTTASTLLDIVKDVEIAISCRKGRTGTAAGDVAFPKGKENLASVLKRYKRRLSKSSASSPDGLSAARKSASCGL